MYKILLPLATHLCAKFDLVFYETLNFLGVPWVLAAQTSNFPLHSITFVRFELVFLDLCLFLTQFSDYLKNKSE